MPQPPAPLLPALLLSLLAPTLALAQDVEPRTRGWAVNDSPLFWYWAVVLALAFALFIWRAVAISRTRRGPPTPRTR